MEPNDLTVKILQEIRDEQRATRTELGAHLDANRTELGHLAEETRHSRDMFEKRFEVIETSLRDMAEQLVMVARGVKVAIEARSVGDRRVDDLERRVAELEKQREPH